MRWRASDARVAPLPEGTAVATVTKDNNNVIHIEDALNEIRENGTPKEEEVSSREASFDKDGDDIASVAKEEGEKDEEEPLDPDVIFWSPPVQLTILLASSLTRFLLAVMYLARMYKIGVALDDPEYPVNNIFEALVLTEEVEAFVRFSLLLFKCQPLFRRMARGIKRYCWR